MAAVRKLSFNLQFHIDNKWATGEKSMKIRTKIDYKHSYKLHMNIFIKIKNMAAVWIVVIIFDIFAT
jgi:hypothetical protein